MTWTWIAPMLDSHGRCVPSEHDGALAQNVFSANHCDDGSVRLVGDKHRSGKVFDKMMISMRRWAFPCRNLMSDNLISTC